MEGGRKRYRQEDSSLVRLSACCISPAPGFNWQQKYKNAVPTCLKCRMASIVEQTLLTTRSGLDCSIGMGGMFVSQCSKGPKHKHKGYVRLLYQELQPWFWVDP